MKKIIEKAIRLRNSQFRFDPHLSSYALAQFILQQSLSMLRGMRFLLWLKNPKGALLGKGVTFFNMPQVRFGKFLKLGDRVHLSALGTDGIKFGNNVGIGAYSRIVVSTSFNDIGKGIKLGNNVGIGEYAYLGGAGGLEIGDDCIVGQYFSCHPENHNYEIPELLIRQQGVNRKGIIIGSNCWIGSKVTILDGVSIGEGCVIAAGSVVNKDLPAYSVAGGVPAKILKERKPITIHTYEHEYDFTDGLCH